MKVNIIPYQRLPKSLGVFTYETNLKVSPGDLVEIPWRNKTLPGLVWEINVKSKISKSKLKRIEKIIEPQILAPGDLKLLQWLSEYYFQSPALFLKTFLPEIKKTKGKGFPEVKTPKLVLVNKESGKIADVVLQNSKTLLELDYKNRLEVYLLLAHKLIQQKRQLIILAPEVSLVNYYVHEFKKHYSSNVGFLYSGIARGRYFKTWQQFKNGELPILIGTRQAIFAVSKSTGLIIVDNEHDYSYKQWDMNPRYDARAIAEHVAKIFKSKLLFTSLSPRVKEWKGWNWIGARPSVPRTDIVDLRDELKAGNYSLFSEKLHESMDKLFNVKTDLKSVRDQAILFINQKGSFAVVVCRDCGYSPKCSHCATPLSYYESKAKLICTHCGRQESLSVNCPNCRGGSYKFMGAGAEQVIGEIKRFWPKASVALLTADDDAEVIDEFKNNQVSILVTTSAFSNKLAGIKVKVGAIVSIDTLLNLPEFEANEIVRHAVKELEMLTTNSFIIQTYNPDHPVWKNLGREKKFQADELKNRKALRYPPFGRIVKLTCQGYKMPEVNTQAKNIAQKIKNAVPEIEVLGPMPEYRQKTRGRYRLSLVIKTDAKNKLDQVMKLVPDDWLIDIDAERLL
ncbi:MAG: primosomal protein N' [Candidatus Buchananbacteria bacterium CG10_big_fil_rev_8_21_14_0_10_42_9]|uniref:Primosomal protein N n=1 Tax=Candidatus Buchananbacteria bacterium CG10_big_fil_rev_8_21_14_0_10_42_9 TaxID=1974526 RepID=A0A2H0W0Z7_9BACT|nr:MAG: primosomal protein N' [Candidatus Buchananbacteria bacterium CG10_big_fil_rev_8_21_14_0_10_42_9]